MTTKFYDIYQEIRIDEEKEIFDLSDQNLIQIKLKIKGETTQNNNNNRKWEEIPYYKTEGEKMKEYVKEIEQRINTGEIKNKEELTE